MPPLLNPAYQDAGFQVLRKPKRFLWVPARGNAVELRTSGMARRGATGSSGIGGFGQSDPEAGSLPPARGFGTEPAEGFMLLAPPWHHFGYRPNRTSQRGSHRGGRSEERRVGNEGR